MSKETPGPRSKPKEISLHSIDADFDTLEQNFSLPERMELTRELFEEVFNPPLVRGGREDHTVRVVAEEGGDIQHFVLPNMLGGEGDIHSVRESYDERSEYIRSADRVFVRVGQGEMWVIPKSDNPYFKVSMSECTAIIGFNESSFAVAHISYSDLEQTKAALQFMQKMEISPRDIYITTSVGEAQAERAVQQNDNRASRLSEYASLGIPKENVTPFEFTHGKVFKDGRRLLNNITQVVGCNDALFQYSLDLIKTPRPGEIFPREDRYGDYKDEKITKL